MKTKSPITDSPWFWVTLFSGMALVALLAMGPKYGGRQSRLEVKYQARERIAADRVAPKSSVDSGQTVEQGGRREFASPDKTLVPLWPLAVVIGIVMALALVMLVREQRCGRLGSLRETSG